ncbi:MAG: hypothetical protein K2H79_06640, partial [Bacteroidaceae bacterium]|nr:hypothetical protein [Bacteroidaceae bacterium]
AVSANCALAQSVATMSMLKKFIIRIRFLQVLPPEIYSLGSPSLFIVGGCTFTVDERPSVVDECPFIDGE